MTTHVPQQDEQSINETSAVEKAQPAIPSPQSASQPLVLPKQAKEEEFFYFEEDQPDPETPFVAPFQRSDAMPTVSPAQPSEPVSAVPPTPARPTTTMGRASRSSLTMLAILACVVVIVGLLVMNALAQTTPPLTTSRQGSSQKAQPAGTSSQQQPVMKPIAAPTAAQAQATNGQEQGTTQAPSDWVPQQLPNGWTNAGLLPEDGIQAIRTAVAFNDREMSLDHRSVGTRTTHSGTFTAATFIMTTAAKQRFAQHDVRKSNNTLFDMVVQNKLVWLVVNPQPQLVQFVQQGQQQFAWVDVAFQRWQSQIDPTAPQQQIAGKELDPTTQQPRIHHMMVLLLHVPAHDAGTNPAMGGTGWLVSTYALDLPNGTALDIVQPA